MRQLAGFVVDIHVALAGAIDAIGPVQAGVEPLRRIRRCHLHCQHVAVLIKERARVVFAGEVAALPAPIGPGSGEPVEHLAGIAFATGVFFVGKLCERRAIGDRAPQP